LNLKLKPLFSLFTSLIDCLKPLITQSHPVQVAQLQMFQMVPVAQVSVAQLESRTHTNFLAEISPRTWVPRKELDVKLTDLVDRLISSQNGSLFIQFHG
jgi:hypothetical protein